MSKTYFIWALGFLLSCQPSGEETATVSAGAVVMTSGAASEAQTIRSTKPLLHVVQRTHAFSSPDQLDYFRLILRGDSIVVGQVEFTITSASGRQLYYEQFSAADLEAALVYEIKKPVISIREREAYILRRMEEFVQSGDFLTPAISANTTPDTTLVPSTVWTRIQERKNAIGFKYLLGKEDGRLLAYDPKQQKAVRYGSFGG